MFSGLAAEQSHASLFASFGNTANDVSDNVWFDLAGRYVVSEKQWFGAAHDDVIGDHRDEIDTDCVVNAHALCDDNFGAHAVSASRKKRAAEFGECAGIKQAGESTEVTNNFRP
jgi:hypothetical protein